ncbi:MAG: hypothetical protein GF364_05010 [Candidatus Lokiarchaeota archaeon]|nr:hypothetical protein [Candidatus Lokiarchaeota archaeon]
MKTKKGRMIMKYISYVSKRGQHRVGWFVGYVKRGKRKGWVKVLPILGQGLKRKTPVIREPLSEPKEYLKEEEEE